MNKSLALLSTALLLAAASPAFAASSVDLTVKGLITPNACTPFISGGGVVDHGKISAADLVQNNPTQLPRVTLQMTINCDAAISFAIKPIDNRADWSSGSGFGLALVNGKKLGTANVRARNIVADAVPSQSIASIDGGQTWYREPGWEVNTLWGWGSLSDPTTLIPVKDLAMDLEVRTTINRADQFDLSNEIVMDANATLEVVYL